MYAEGVLYPPQPLICYTYVFICYMMCLCLYFHTTYNSVGLAAGERWPEGPDEEA